VNIATHICRCYPCWRGREGEPDRALVFECHCRDGDRSTSIARANGITMRGLMAAAMPTIPAQSVVVARSGPGMSRIVEECELDVVHTAATLPPFLVWSGSRCWALDQGESAWWRWMLWEVTTSLAASLDPEGPCWPSVEP
jgi:hypothetical protein